MIFAHVDSLETKNIVGFECGTRNLFDSRRSGDPLWIFIDNNNARFRSDLSDFLKNPTTYYIDNNGNLRKK
jgi:hypothetical protein